jgi:hypothetical protein
MTTPRTVRNALRCARGLRTAIVDARVKYSRSLADVPLKLALKALNDIIEPRLLDARRRVVERRSERRAA